MVDPAAGIGTEKSGSRSEKDILRKGGAQPIAEHRFLQTEVLAASHGGGGNGGANRIWTAWISYYF